MNLSVGILLAWLDEAGGRLSLERVLHIAAPPDAVVVIDVEDRLALPFTRARQHIEHEYACGRLQICETEPFPRSFLTEDGLVPERHRRVREHAFSLITELMQTAGAQLLSSDARASAINRFLQEQPRKEKPTKKYIYRQLRRFWQRGMTKGALLPDYDRCGSLKVSEGSAKRGRPRKLTPGLGINIGAREHELILKGYQRFYLNKRQSLLGAYQDTLEAFFAERLVRQGAVWITVLKPPDQRPTFGQFAYHCRKAFNPAEVCRSRGGERAYALRYRPLLGNTSDLAFGPGSIYQIDSTPADVHLVSSLDPRCTIGRPTLYFVTDVFSRMIVGLWLGMEYPSYAAAALALESAIASKVEFCARYGVEIDAEDWPAQGIPELVLADRGDLLGLQSVNLPENLNVVLANTAPYRADLKPVVERYFRFANEKLFHKLPGAVRGPRTRGESDPRLEASLTAADLWDLVLRAVRVANQRYLTKYKRDRQMIADGVKACPVDLWRWGIRNRTGHLRSMGLDLVRFALLPRGTASVRGDGIHFGGSCYTCDLAVREHWFTRARLGKSMRFPVAFDPRRLDEVYLYLPGQVKPVPCCRMSRDNRFAGCTWEDQQVILSQERAGGAEAMSKAEQDAVELNGHVRHRAQEALRRRQAVAACEPINDAKRVANVRRNRSEEIEKERGESARGFESLSDNPAKNLNSTLEASVGRSAELLARVRKQLQEGQSA